MLVPIEFHLFPALPKELQEIIWSHTITPQLIPLTQEIYDFNPRHAPSFLYLLGGYAPHTHFTVDTPERPSSPYYTAHLVPVGFLSPSPLAVCRESRAALLANGYKRWKIVRQNGQVRYVMWKPSIDTVFLKEDSFHHFYEPLHLFYEQFPTQVPEVERIAMPSSLWDGDASYAPTRQFVPLIPFKLRELVVMVDDEFERAYVERLKARGVAPGPNDPEMWVIPRDITTALEREGRHSSLWTVPNVRIVRGERGVLSGDDLELRLRCYPYEALGLGEQEARS